jgi:hypothetical protein
VTAAVTSAGPTPRVVLVYEASCPHVDAARANVRAALAARGLPPSSYAEQRSDASDAPEWARALGSPSVLVDGVDVEAAPGAGGCCRVYRDANGGRASAPSTEAIVRALGA